MIHNLFQQVLSGIRGNRHSHRVRLKRRRLSMEPLESRQLLSITLPAGTSIFVPLRRQQFRQYGELRRDGFGLFQAHSGHDAADQ